MLELAYHVPMYRSARNVSEDKPMFMRVLRWGINNNRATFHQIIK